MPFRSGDKEYSDQKVASDVKKGKQLRHEWCEQQAREYLATHPRRKYYFTEYYIPEAEQETYVAWAQNDIDKLKSALADDIAENGPYDEEDEIEARREIIQNLDLDLSYYIPEVTKYGEWEIWDINLEKYIYCEHANVLRFDKEDDTPKKERCVIELTDEEYILVLTELLYAAEELSFDGLRTVLPPELGKRMWQDCASHNSTTAIFLTEINQQVKMILEKNGGRENTPYYGLFHNPFAIMAEHLASKAEKK